MIPYGDFYFFYVIALALAPAVVLGLLEVRVKWYGVLASAYMAHVIFASSQKELFFFVFFVAAELLLVFACSLAFRKKRPRWALWIAVVLAAAPLGAAKLSGTAVLPTTVGFLGVSYLTFKVLQVVIQLYDRSLQKIDWYNLLYFIVFFPTLSAGPIDRYGRFAQDADRKLSRREYVGLLGDGLFWMMQGVAYKFIAAYAVQRLWLDKIPLHSAAPADNLAYMYAYSLYLFFDFAGYSLIAVGTGCILGVRTPQNFRLPFISRDMKDFWNRWHMTLSFWFRDFVYNRFVMAALKNKWFKNCHTASCIGFMVTMGAMGLWHGLAVYYILYGLYHGSLLAAADWAERRPAYKRVKEQKWFRFVSVAVTFHLVCFGFYLFSGYLFL